MTIDQIITSRNWQFYISRNFTLFGASIWQHWYDSEETELCFGSTLSDVLFLEEEKSVARCYRAAEQIEQQKETVRKIIYDKKRILALFHQGLELNNRAIRVLEGKEKFEKVKDAVDFITSLALRATMLPFRMELFLSEKAKPDPEVVSLMEKLRAISYYPRIMDEIIIPMTVQELGEKGITNAEEVVKFITYRELLAGHFDRFKKRQDLSRADTFFVFVVINNTEYIYLIKDRIKLLKQLEPRLNFEKVEGKGVYPGIARGKVRMVNSRSIKNIDFKTGEIFVSVSTSPLHLPLMKKAAAIIADEGGLTSHTAILARELKIPAIIGTGVATKILKDGDMVEVDAKKGTVRIIKQ